MCGVEHLCVHTYVLYQPAVFVLEIKQINTIYIFLFYLKVFNKRYTTSICSVFIKAINISFILRYTTSIWSVLIKVINISFVLLYKSIQSSFTMYDRYHNGDVFCFLGAVEFLLFYTSFALHLHYINISVILT